MNIILILIVGALGAVFGIWVRSALNLPGELWIYAILGFLLGLIGPTLYEIFD